MFAWYDVRHDHRTEHIYAGRSAFTNLPESLTRGSHSLSEGSRDICNAPIGGVPFCSVPYMEGPPTTILQLFKGRLSCLILAREKLGQLVGRLNLRGGIHQKYNLNYGKGHSYCPYPHFRRSIGPLQQVDMHLHEPLWGDGNGDSPRLAVALLMGSLELRSQGSRSKPLCYEG